MPTIYVRQEPTEDSEILPSARKYDWVFYRTPTCHRPYCRIPWYYDGPKPRDKSIILNCVRWRLVWL